MATGFSRCSWEGIRVGGSGRYRRRAADAGLPAAASWVYCSDSPLRRTEYWSPLALATGPFLPSRQAPRDRPLPLPSCLTLRSRRPTRRATSAHPSTSPLGPTRFLQASSRGFALLQPCKADSVVEHFRLAAISFSVASSICLILQSFSCRNKAQSRFMNQRR
jgi:hypothetical protein